MKVKLAINQAFKESEAAYGARRIKEALYDDHALIVSRKRIVRLMKEDDLVPKMRKRFKQTTCSNHHREIHPNIVSRHFFVDKPNIVWVGDITYIKTDEGWIYLAVFIDLFSRSVVGWSLQNRMTDKLVIDALDMAIKRRNPQPGLIVHSDRGSQYASRDCQRVLALHGFIGSMSRKGNCWDNSPSESFFKTLKVECVDDCRFRTREEAMNTVFQYIETFYNRRRLHSTVGYLSPFQYEVNYERRLNIGF
jgi:transposase InsO family protein